MYSWMVNKNYIEYIPDNSFTSYIEQQYNTKVKIKAYVCIYMFVWYDNHFMIKYINHLELVLLI